MSSLNSTPSSERVHIGFFGTRNAGKSSVMNAITGQDIALVSHIKGTTTDPVKKTMELLPLGPVVMIDTPGIDDVGELGRMRIHRTEKMLHEVDIAILVVDSTEGLRNADLKLLKQFKSAALPYLILFNKSDLADHPIFLPQDEKEHSLAVSAITGENIAQAKDLIAHLVRHENTKDRLPLVSDLVNTGDTVILVIPIDASAPKGRIILPQQAVLRELLDKHTHILCVQTEELESAIDSLKNPPSLIVTDSHVFRRVMEIVPEEIPVTSFSILFSRFKGDLKTQVAGASLLSSLTDTDHVLISEGCTHHRQCGDLGTEKLPRFIEHFCGAKPHFSFSSGEGFPGNLTPYTLVIHCGGCMLTEKAMHARLETARSQNVPMTNYGTAIAEINNILERALRPFKNIY